MLKYLFTSIIIILSPVLSKDQDLDYTIDGYYSFKGRLIESQWSAGSDSLSSRLLYGMVSLDRQVHSIQNKIASDIPTCSSSPLFGILSAEYFIGHHHTLGVMIEAYYPPEFESVNHPDPLAMWYKSYDLEKKVKHLTDFNSPDVFVLHFHGHGKYIAYNKRNKSLVLGDPYNEVYNEVDLTDLFLKFNIPVQIINNILPGTARYNYFTGSCVFSFTMGRKGFMALIDKYLNLRWITEGDFQRGQFSPSGRYFAFRGYSEEIDNWRAIVTVIDSAGYNVATFDVGPTPWKDVRFYEKDDLLLIQNSQHAYICQVSTGKVLRKINSGSSFSDLVPSKNLLITARGGPAPFLSVYDVSDTTKTLPNKIWQTELSSSADRSAKLLHIDASDNGSQITVATDQNLWLLVRKE